MTSLPSSHYQFVRRLVQHRSGIVLDAGKDYLIDFRLSELARELGESSVERLLDRAQRHQDSGLAQRIVHAMATHETSFFRDRVPWDVLRAQVLPDLIERRRLERRLRIWSAACSTGQEPYSIAISILEHHPTLASWDVRILGTDLCDRVLRRAREGRYSNLEVGRGVPSALLVKYFEKDGLEWRLRSIVRERVEFRPLNLTERWPSAEELDLIFLRNVLIYFDPPTKRDILSRIRQRLRPDGYLFLGGSETTFNLADEFEALPGARTACFRLRGGTS